MRNVRCRGSERAAITVHKCFQVVVEDCYSEQWDGDLVGLNYGLVIANSQNVNVRGGGFIGDRHGITIGGGDDAGQVINRFIDFDAVLIESTTATSVGAMGYHGNMEYATIRNCTLRGRVNYIFGGDHTIFENNTCIASERVAEASEMLGMDHVFKNNRMLMTGDGTAVARANFIDMGTAGGDPSTNATRGGTIVIEDNVMTLSQSQVSSIGVGMIQLQMRGSVADNNIRIARNQFNPTAQVLNTLIVQVRSTTGDNWNRVELTNNRAFGQGLVVHDAASVVASDNYIRDSLNVGLQVLAEQNGFVVVEGNDIDTCAFSGIYVAGEVGTTGKAHIAGNTVLNCNSISTGSSNTNTAVYVTNFEFVTFVENLVTSSGDEAAYLVNMINSAQAGECYVSGNRLESETDDIRLRVNNFRGFNLTGNVIDIPGSASVLVQNVTNMFDSGNDFVDAGVNYNSLTNAPRTPIRGSAQITSAATSVVVTHDILGNPPAFALDDIQVTPQSTLGSASFFWVSSPTTTGFTNNTDAAPGAAVTLGWQINKR